MKLALLPPPIDRLEAPLEEMFKVPIITAECLGIRSAKPAYTVQERGSIQYTEVIVAGHQADMRTAYA